MHTNGTSSEKQSPAISTTETVESSPVVGRKLNTTGTGHSLSGTEQSSPW